MSKNEKKTSARMSVIAAVVSLLTLAGFVYYGKTYDYFDTVVCGCLALATILGFAYAIGKGAFSATFNLLAVIALGFGLGIFFLNSYPVWADRLNNISMYGSRGTLAPVIAIIAGTLLAAFLEIISCFTRREVL